jgi:hypothetical protein
MRRQIVIILDTDTETPKQNLIISQGETHETETKTIWFGDQTDIEKKQLFDKINAEVDSFFNNQN